MRDAVDRLATDQAPDHAQVVAAVSDAVWWVTIVDAALVRYRHQAYESVMHACAAARGG